MADNTAQNSEADGQSPHRSSTRVRQRKAALTGSQKHEDAARTADYKAMLYSRKAVQEKLAYRQAPEDEKVAMLERAMRETMEKRRAKGQDTMSKMAAYSAGQRRRTTVGPATRVPIADFLVSNGYVPMTSSRASQARDRKQRNGVDAGTSDLLNTIQDRTQTSGEGELISVLNPSMQSIDGLPHFGSMVLSYQSSAPEDQGHIAQPGDSHVISDSDNLMSAQGRKTPVDIKPDLSPAPFANMQLLNSIEGDGSEASQICALRSEVFELRSIVQSLQDHETVFSKAVVNNSHPGLATSNFRTAELSRHVGQLEGMVRAIQPSMTVAEEHIEVLEGIVQELTKKSGDGCDAEKAKMCETVRSLKEAMSNLANLSKMLASVNASPTQASPSSTCI